MFFHGPKSKFTLKEAFRKSLMISNMTVMHLNNLWRENIDFLFRDKLVSFVSFHRATFAKLPFRSLLPVVHPPGLK